MRRILCLFVGISTLLIPTRANAAIIAVFTGVGAGELRTDWEAAVGAFVEETFEDGLWQGVTAIPVGPGHDQGSVAFGISGGVFHDRVQPGTSTQLNFTTPTTAFGANFDTAGPGGSGGLGLTITANGTVVPIQVPAAHAGLFFGFISDVPFTQIILTTGTSPGGAAESYDLDNAVWATQATAVPEPASLTLFGLALLGLAARRARRRAP